MEPWCNWQTVSWWGPGEASQGRSTPISNFVCMEEIYFDVTIQLVVLPVQLRHCLPLSLLSWLTSCFSGVDSRPCRSFYLQSCFRARLLSFCMDFLAGIWLIYCIAWDHWGMLSLPTYAVPTLDAAPQKKGHSLCWKHPWFMVHPAQ